MEDLFNFNIIKDKDEYIERNLLFYEYIPNNKELGKVVKINFYNKNHIEEDYNNYIENFKRKFMNKEEIINIVPQKITKDIENKLDRFKNKLDYKNKLTILELNSNKNIINTINNVNNKNKENIDTENKKKLEKKIKLEDLIEEEFLDN